MLTSNFLFFLYYLLLLFFGIFYAIGFEYIYLFLNSNGLTSNFLCVYVFFNKNNINTCINDTWKKKQIIPISGLPVSFRVKTVVLLKDILGTAAGKELMCIQQPEATHSAWNSFISFLCHILAYLVSLLLSCLFIKYVNLGSLNFLFVVLFLLVWVFLYRTITELLLFYFVDSAKK